MAITRLSSTSSASGLTTAVPAGLGYITETSFSQAGISASGTAFNSATGRIDPFIQDNMNSIYFNNLSSSPL